VKRTEAHEGDLHRFCGAIHWVWGRQVEEYGYCLYYVGLGPMLFLAALPGVLPIFLLVRS
jgi:hypothetical protein